jgi:hypothetical protein
VRVGEGPPRLPHPVFEVSLGVAPTVRKVRVCGPNFLYYILFFLREKGTLTTLTILTGAANP